MAVSAGHEEISEDIRAFFLAVEKAGPMTDTAQALVAHVKAELDKAQKTEEDRERWRQWWQQSTYVNLQTYVEVFHQCFPMKIRP